MAAFIFTDQPISSPSQSAFIHDLPGKFSFTITTANQSYHRNQQYSIIALTDGGGSIVERYAYTAYGAPTITAANGTVRTTSAHANRYTYTGREWDETVELYHFRARMYDAGLGRFLGRDPIGYAGSEWNLYSQFDNRSLVALDPSGEALLILKCLAVVGVAYGSVCVGINLGFHKGTRHPTPNEQSCLDNLWSTVRPSHCKKSRIKIDPNAGSPVTKCNPLCPGGGIFFGPRDVQCGSCSGALNTLLSIMHECVHEQKQSCRRTSTDCGEYEAYKSSTEELSRNRTAVCNSLVGFGYCESSNQCDSEVTTLIASEMRFVESYGKKCHPDRELDELIGIEN